MLNSSRELRSSTRVIANSCRNVQGTRVRRAATSTYKPCANECSCCANGPCCANAQCPGKSAKSAHVGGNERLTSSRTRHSKQIGPCDSHSTADEQRSDRRVAGEQRSDRRAQRLAPSGSHSTAGEQRSDQRAQPGERDQDPNPVVAQRRARRLDRSELRGGRGSRVLHALHGSLLLRTRGSRVRR
jgi:hypothetical protein